MNKFKTKSGRLTRYALACGYVENFEKNGKRLQLWHEGGPLLHVRLHDHENHVRIFWESFETLKDARKCFDKAKREM